MKDVPAWMADLTDQDMVFIKNFVLASGSLKEIAKLYEVSYPTVRLRLDRLIQKIKINESTEQLPHVALIKRLAIEGKLDFETAKLLIDHYKQTLEEI